MDNRPYYKHAVVENLYRPERNHNLVFLKESKSIERLPEQVHLANPMTQLMFPGDHGA